MPQTPDFKKNLNSIQHWEELHFAANLQLRPVVEHWMVAQTNVVGVRVKLLNTVSARLERILFVGEGADKQHKALLNEQEMPYASITVYGEAEESSVKLLEESLRSNLFWLQSLQAKFISADVLDRVSVIIYQATEIDGRWVLTQANQALAEFLGSPVDDFIGANAKKVLTEFVHPDDLAQLLSSYDFTKSMSRSITVTYRMLSQTGEYIPVTERVEYYPSKTEKRCNSVIWNREQDQLNPSQQKDIYSKIERFSHDINIETGDAFLLHFCRRLATIDKVSSAVLLAHTKHEWWESFTVSSSQADQANQAKYSVALSAQHDVTTFQWNQESISEQDKVIEQLLFPGSVYQSVIPLYVEDEQVQAVLLLGSKEPLAKIESLKQMVQLFSIRILREIGQMRIANAQTVQNQLLTNQKHQLTKMVSLLGQLDTVSNELEFIQTVETHLRQAFELQCLDWLFWSSGDWFSTQPILDVDEDAQWFQHAEEVTTSHWLSPLEECRRKGETSYYRGRLRLFWPIGASEAGFLVCVLTFQKELPDEELILFSQNALVLALQGLVQRENLRYQAMHDSLTGLGNRVQLHAWTKAILPNASIASLLVFDLNRFKEINDSFGHQFGDKLLQEIGPRISGYLSDTEHYLARLGGDEFALLLPHLSLDEANYIGDQLHKELAQSYVIDGLRFQVEASVGVAHYPSHGADSHELLRCADVAMYAAKNSTRKVVAFEAELDNSTPLRIAVLSGLDEAIAEEQLWVAYQPLMSTKTGQVAGFEALIRWTHPKFGPLSPGEFIPITEMGEGIRKITDFVLRQTMSHLKSWRQLMPSLHVAVNVSPRVLLDHQFPNNIQNLLDEFNMPGDALILELTESTLLVDPIRAVEIITVLADKGIKVEIDDFGTGYSSLAYLKSLPISALKIDRSFVTDILEDNHNEVIVASTIQMAHSLGLMTVAEGVEDEATLQKMMRLKCDMIQGFYFAKPIAGDNVNQWLQRNL